MSAHQNGTLMEELREKAMKTTTSERLLPQCICPLSMSVVKLLVADLGPLLVSITRNQMTNLSWRGEGGAGAQWTPLGDGHTV